MSKPVFRQAPWALLLLFSTWCVPGFAAPPPSMSLPECTEEAMQKGFCPRPNTQLEMTAAGRFGAGASVTVTAKPVLPVCDYHSGQNSNGNPWSPSPCWASVSEGAEALCLYYDLQAAAPSYKMASCASVLYLKAGSVPAALFKYFNKDGVETRSCGGKGDYGTFIYGGDGSVPAERWVNKGLTYTDCTVAFNGPRPDGLYGPTWIRATTSIGIAQTGDYRGAGHYTSTFVWLPVDGDMRQDFLDVETFLYYESLEQDDDGYTARLKLHVKNNGNKPANNTKVVVSLPPEIHVLRTSDSRCSLEKRAWAGGSFDCTLSLPGNSGTEFIDIDIRIVNNKELERPVKVEAVIDGDKFPENNLTSDTIRIRLPQADVDAWKETLRLMEPLAEHFNYRVAVWNRKMCSIFAEDIYDRFEQIHRASPEVFAQLSYGRITTGAYIVPGSQIIGGHTSQGHVGVVVYPKGTDYLRTGIVVHGTPTWSYLDVDSQTLVGPLGTPATSFQGAMGIASLAGGGIVSQVALNFGTAQHGLYYRTPAMNMAGNLVAEGGLGCGFEGVYPDNEGAFREPLTCATESTLTPRTEKVASCPIYPDAVTVQTESPVEIHLKNAKGQRVETQDGRIVAQELDSEIFSWALPHDDGTYAWTLVLPKDKYDIQLVGTGTGPYKLTFTTFDADGTAIADVYEGVATPGHTSDYTLLGATDNTESNVTVEATKKKGGGGSLDLLLLSLLGSLAGWRLLHLRRSRVRRGH